MGIYKVNKISTFLIALPFLACPQDGYSARNGTQKLDQRCDNGNISHVKRPETAMRDRHVNPDSPCPNLDNSNIPETKCQDLVQDLITSVENWRTAASQYCNIRQDFQACTQDSCRAEQAALLKNAKAKVMDERRAIKEAKENIRQLREAIASQVIQPGTETINQAKSPIIDQQAQAVLDANGSSTQNVLNGADKFGGASQSQLFELANKVREGSLTDSDISSANGAFVEEPLRFAMAMQDLEKQLGTRDQEVSQRGDQFDAGASTDNENINKGTSLVDSNIDPARSSAAGVDVSGTPTGETLGDVAGAAGPAAGALGALNGGGGGGSGSGSGNVYNTAAGPVYSSYSGSAPVSSRFAGDSDSGGGSGPQVLSIDVADAAAARLLDAEGKPISSSAASSAGSDRLRALREKLQRKSGTGTRRGGDAGSASTAGARVPGGTDGSGTGEESGGSGRVNPRKFGEIVGGPGGRSLAGENLLDDGFQMSGSETDAYVQSMVNSFGEMAGNGYASTEEDGAPEILGADTASLFSRTTDTLKRSVKKGLVTFGTSTRL